MLDAKLYKISQGLRQCFSLASLFFSHTVTDCMIGHSVRKRCGVEMLQQVPVKGVGSSLGLLTLLLNYMYHYHIIYLYICLAMLENNV